MLRLHLHRHSQAQCEESHARELAVDPQCLPQVRLRHLLVARYDCFVRSSSHCSLDLKLAMDCTQLQGSEELKMRGCFHKEDPVPTLRLWAAAG